MATQDNPQLPNAAELTPEQLANQIAAQQTGGEPPEDPRGYTFQTETGSVFQGRTKQEVIDKMLKSSEHASKRIKELDDQLARYHELEQQMAAQAQPPPPEPEGFNPQRYYELWAQNPNAAEDYRFQSTFGVTQQEMANQIYQSYQFTNQIKPEVTMRSWMATSDFPTSDPEQLEKAASAFEGVWNEFYPNDFDFTPQKLEMVHAVSVKRGLYQPERQVAANVSQNAGNFDMQQAQQLAQSSPMPTLNVGTSGGGTGPDQQIARMTPEQLRALIEQQPR